MQLVLHPALQVPVQLLLQLSLHPPVQAVEQLEHPAVSAVPVQEVMQLDEQAEVQSVQGSFLQLLNKRGNALEKESIPMTGKVFLAASLKNSLLFCNFLLFISCVFYVIIMLSKWVSAMRGIVF